MNELEFYAQLTHDSCQIKFNLDILTKINSIETKINNIEQKINIFETKLNNIEEKLKEIDELKRKNNIFDKIIHINNSSINNILKTISANERKQELINDCLRNRIDELNVKQKKNKILKIYLNKILRKKRLNKNLHKTKLNISKIKKIFKNI